MDKYKFETIIEGTLKAHLFDNINDDMLDNLRREVRKALESAMPKSKIDEEFEIIVDGDIENGQINMRVIQKSVIDRLSKLADESDQSESSDL